MDNLFLVFPDEEHEKAWINIINEFKNTGEKVMPYGLWYDTDDYYEYLKKIKNFRDGIDIPSHLVKADTFFLTSEGDSKILGAVNIRHSLNDNLLKSGGHIGYGIAPTERRKGYAARLLKMALEKCRNLSIYEVLITCDKDNVGSAKTIIKNGGILENEIMEDNGTVMQRYWIRL